MNTPPNSKTHPWKVEAWDFTRPRPALIGRAMFETKEDAESFAKDDSLPVLKSKPTDTEFA